MLILKDGHVSKLGGGEIKLVESGAQSKTAAWWSCQDLQTGVYDSLTKRTVHEVAIKKQVDRLQLSLDLPCSMDILQSMGNLPQLPRGFFGELFQSPSIITAKALGEGIWKDTFWAP